MNKSPELQKFELCRKSKIFPD